MKSVSYTHLNRSAKQIFGVENIKKHENVFTINQSERFEAAVDVYKRQRNE